MSTQVLDPETVSRLLPEPTSADHKYTRGVVALVTGSRDYPGAGVLSAGGASYSGAGLVRFRGSAEAAHLALQQFPEVVLSAGRTDAVVLGSGWGEDLAPNAAEVLQDFAGPLVVDAGYLGEDGWASHPGPVVLTPHWGEARRLADRLSIHLADAGPEAARTLAAATGATVVLKGATTWTAAPSGNIYAYEARSAWPGVAGSGDVLAGVLGGVLARAAAGAHRGVAANPAHEEMSALIAAAVWLHGEAGALAATYPREAEVDFRGGPTAARRGTGPVRARDIIEALPAVWAGLP